MSNISIDLRTATRNPEYVLLQNLAHAGSGDTITITVDRRQAHEVDNLFSVLENEGFEVLPKGGEADAYNIIAQRRHN